MIIDIIKCEEWQDYHSLFLYFYSKHIEIINHVHINNTPFYFYLYDDGRVKLYNELQKSTQKEIPFPITFQEFSNKIINQLKIKDMNAEVEDQQEKNRTSRFLEITNQMLETYQRKNRDYGNSYEQSLDKHGLIAGVVRMEDKLNRINSLTKRERQVMDESMEDTLADLATYAVMTLVYIRGKQPVYNDDEK